MTTDQTIDGVSRELLEDMLNPCADFATHERLRALLDAPAKHDDDLAKTYKTYEGQTVRIGRDGGIELVHDELAKPYGYMYHPDGRKDDEFFIYDAPKDRVPDHRGEYWTATPLYTEQPAPVAVVLPARIASDHLNEMAQGWNACIDAVTRLNDIDQ